MDAFAQVAGTPLGGSTPPLDMSVYGLFLQADWIVKAVMIVLLLASFWTWAIIFEKMIRLRALQAERAAVRGHVLVRRLARGPVRPVGAKPADPMSASSSPRCANGAARPPRAWRPPPRRARRCASASSGS